MSSEQLLNKAFGPYILLKRLGVGGMAETYLAMKQGPDGARRFVALKCILSHCNSMPEFVRMFYHEARLGLCMNHPNIVQTWDVTDYGHRHTMVMEYMYGSALDDVLKKAQSAQKPMPLEVALWVSLNILDALYYMHNLRDLDGTPLHIVHRDVSPQNIFLGYDGQSKLFDFGVATSEQQSSGSQPGMIVGKYAYMSPEQCHGAPVDGRADIFSLAVVLYEMTTGKRLFERENDIKTLDALNHGEIVPPTGVRSDFPAYLSKIIMRGLERDIERRYPSAHEFADEIRTFMKISGYPQTCLATQKYLAELFDIEIAQQERFMADALVEVAQKFPPPPIDLSGRPCSGSFDELAPINQGEQEVAVSRIATIKTISSPDHQPVPRPVEASNDDGNNDDAPANKLVEVLSQPRAWQFATAGFAALFVLMTILLIAQ